ncbi:hypothetical protein [Micromonospora krabiensis]|uniref:Uncharacterized protein n=1 Tax=Micromonospora krabiensis TaxID=307121 RepID=A0A1C3N4M0_9ACTN|nr:hypothetical protein [Micromonospora krabiensis]SBV27524.1 hypothetical protein GA0070620_3048 [Micromonospora krabiensis]
MRALYCVSGRAARTGQAAGLVLALLRMRRHSRHSRRAIPLARVREYVFRSEYSWPLGQWVFAAFWCGIVCWLRSTFSRESPRRGGRG